MPPLHKDFPPLLPQPDSLIAHENNFVDTTIVTPVRLQPLIPYLKGYPEAQYLIDGIKNGFKLGYTGERHFTFSPNLKSCTDFPDIVANKIQKELQAKRIRGPFINPPFQHLHISPIGVVPKKSPGQYRLIQHLSYPDMNSINDFIDPELSTVRYTSFDDAIKQLLISGQGSFMAKTDIDSAFRILPIHPSDYELLGIHFQGKYFYDTCLPMGASSSCAIFESFSSSLEWIARNRLHIQHIIHILDDFLIFGNTFNSCQSHLDKFLQLCLHIGVPIKKEKTESACQTITFMGLELDSINMEARLPADKLTKLRELLHSFSRCRKITLKELQSILGLLNFCCQVVLPGRCFLRRLTDLTLKVTKQYHHITLTRESRRDLKAWEIFIEHFNGKNILLEKRWIEDKNLHLHTDASGAKGFAAIFQKHWFNGAWPPHMSHFHITFKELFPIVLAIEIWGSHLRNKCLVIHTDNMAVMHIINKQTSKETSVMKLVRRLVLACMQFNILLRSVHIPGKKNVLPDLLSRFQVSRFHQIAPHMEQFPVPVPEKLLTLH